MKRILFAIIAALSLTSCEDVIDIKTGDAVIQPVVDGWVFDDRDTQQVRLTYSQPFFDKGEDKVIDNAQVFIAEGTQPFQLLTYAGKGIYKFAKRGKVDSTYHLKIRLAGDSFTSQAKINPVPQIDSLSFIPRDKSPGREEGFEVRVGGRDLKNRRDNYRFRVAKNNKFFSNASNIIVISDETWDGAPFIEPIQQQVNVERWKSDSLITVEVWSLNELDYNFYNEASTQMNNSGLFANPPANVATNIWSSSSVVSKKAIGHFGASAISRKSRVVPKPKP